MTPAQLVDDLAEELGKALSHIRLPSPRKKETKINIFKYGLPIGKTKEDEDRKFPYVLVIPEGGTLAGGTEPQEADVHLLIGVYDDGMENQGKHWVMNIISDICERFSKETALAGRYYADEKMAWAVDTEEEYPYHYGIVDLIFYIPAFRKEDKYA